jgi:hypothetical protein
MGHHIQISLEVLHVEISSYVFYIENRSSKLKGGFMSSSTLHQLDKPTQELADTTRWFPGPAITGIAMIAGPAMGIVGAATYIGIYGASGVELLSGFGVAAGRAGIAVNAATLAMLLLMPAIVGLATLISMRQPRLGRVGGLLSLVGLGGPLFFQGVYTLTLQLAQASVTAGAPDAIDATQASLHVINLAGVALVAGFIVLAIGAARSSVLPRARAILLGLSALLPAGFIGGIIEISAGAFIAMFVALAPLGIRLLRGDDL